MLLRIGGLPLILNWEPAEWGTKSKAISPKILVNTNELLGH